MAIFASCTEGLSTAQTSASTTVSSTTGVTASSTTSATDPFKDVEPIEGSTGLEYKLIGDAYAVVGIGTCTDKELVVGNYYNGTRVTEIRSGAFRSLDFTNVVIACGIKEIDYNAFVGTNIGSITIPRSVIEIDTHAFRGCTVTGNIKVENGNHVYHSDGNCIIETDSRTVIKGAQNCTIPDDGSVQIIAIDAFENCKLPAIISLPSALTAIGPGAFSGTDITSITIPSSVNAIGEYKIGGIRYSGSPFGNCAHLESVEIEKGNPKYHSEGNCIIETATKTLVYGIKSSVIPVDGSVTSIAMGAFKECLSLKNIIIPESVTTIGETAFSDCTLLENITILNGVTEIGARAFHGCTRLESITIPKGVMTIEDGTFYDCTNLTNVTIPEGVTVIDESAFRYCSSLTSVALPTSVTKISSFAFCNCTALSGVYFAGTKAEWEAISKGEYWDGNTADCTVYCIDGEIDKE